MSAEVTRLELNLRRRAVLGCSVGLALYALVTLVLYPQFQHSTGAVELMRKDPALSALMGISGSFATLQGWLDANVYDNFFPLVLLLLCIGYGASATAGQDEEGTLALIATLPMTRRRIVLQKMTALLAQTLVLVAVVAATVLAGRLFGQSLPPGRIADASVLLLALGVDFGLLALLVGTVTGSRGLALGAGGALAAASYLVSSLAPVVSWVHPLRFGSLFYWAAGNGQLEHGLSGPSLLVLAGFGVILAGMAVVAFERMDMH